MTPEEMGKALGPGWRWQAGWRGAPGSWQWFLNGPEAAGVEVEEADDGTDGWAVSVHDNDGNMATLPAMASERAVAVAGLLVAAERIAAGAGVDHQRLPLFVVHGFPPDHILSGQIGFGMYAVGPSEARRFALDLLRAADEAEAPASADRRPRTPPGETNQPWEQYQPPSGSPRGFAHG